MSRSSIWALGCGAILVMLASAGVGPTAAAQDKPQPDAKPPAKVTSEQETAALDFAAEHHPELAKLIHQLRENKRPEYAAAIRQLADTEERLTRLRERSEGDYRIQLAIWKLDSRIQLLAARMSVANKPELETQLERLLRQRHELRLRNLRREREKAVARVERADELIERFEAEGEEIIQRQVARYRRLSSRGATPLTAPAPGDKPRKTKTDKQPGEKPDKKPTKQPIKKPGDAPVKPTKKSDAPPEKKTPAADAPIDKG